MTPQEHKWVETNNSLCAVLRQVHDVLALSSLPPKREWVGLTDEEIWSADPRIGTSDSNVNPYQILINARAIEATLKRKNYD